jgi:hypothetical protein
VLSFFVKLCIAIAPFLSFEDDFILGDKLEEAREFASAGSTKAMLFSSPILFALRTASEASTVCHVGIDALFAVLGVVVLAVALYGCYKLPTWLFRGTVTVVIWLFMLLVFETVSENYLLQPVAQLLCA